MKVIYEFALETAWLSKGLKNTFKFLTTLTLYSAFTWFEG